MSGIVRAMFEGLKDAREQNYDRKFHELNKEMDCWIGTATTRLLGVDELNDLLKHAETKDQCESILEHMYRHDATQVGYYRDIEKKIIHRFWEG